MFPFILKLITQCALISVSLKDGTDNFIITSLIEITLKDVISISWNRGKESKQLLYVKRRRRDEEHEVNTHMESSYTIRGCLKGAASPEFITEFDHNYGSGKHVDVAVGRLTHSEAGERKKSDN